MVSLALGLVAHRAGAQTAAQASHFAAAQRLYDGGAYAEAYVEFRALAAETRSPNADLYVARCLRGLGRLPVAHAATVDALRNAATRAESDPRYAPTRDAAAVDLARLDLKVGKIVIAVADPPADLVVTLDGAPLPLEKLGVAVAANVGDAVVRLRAPGRREIERSVPLRAGETTTLVLGASSADAWVAASQPTGAIGRGRVAGFFVAGLGVAGIATFAVAGVMANQRYDALFARCGGNRCTDPSLASAVHGGHSLDVIADVGLGVGIAGLAGGALLIALGGPKTPLPQVTAWATPRGGGLTFLRSF